MEKQLAIIENKTGKKQLLSAIKRKRVTFTKLQKKVATLQKELNDIEDEYSQRIGKLYQEDTLLDVAIIRRRKINELVTSGKTTEEAEQEVRHNMEEDTEKMENERIETFIHLFDEETSQIPEESSIRKLWKKLVRQFHPDLTNNKKEKAEREKIIKTINSAYKENDLETLQTIEENGMLSTLNSLERAGVSELELLLVNIENLIIRLKNTYRSLMKSEWYAFWKLPKKGREALFADMEKKIQEDIKRKQTLLTTLMKEGTV